ncbi:beta-galactoside-binding lectin-like [Epinephelus fuscoguttatus]|uniref:beta-galactoside-binding lectin-like n=1 Tax=Epinephelus fuscoguttatus TaxID=293821 RepID=UPI0020D0A31C|nr:beta-galactoside-binding lectin-like [Epinephelus fuscoguttatus]
MIKWGMVVKNMPFEVGQKMTAVGVPNHNAEQFSVNIGLSEQEIALHINPRFNANGDEKTVVCSSHLEGSWGEEMRIKNFPFQQGEEFKIIVEFSESGFMVILPDGFKFTFLNRPGAKKYSCFSFGGEVSMKRLEVD